MGNHKLFQRKHVPICDFNVASCFRLELVLLRRLSKYFVDEKLPIHILDLTVQNPHCNLVDKDPNGGPDHFLEPFPDENVRVLVSIVKVIDDRSATNVLAVDVGNDLRKLPHDKFERL